MCQGQNEMLCQKKLEWEMSSTVPPFLGALVGIMHTLMTEISKQWELFLIIQFINYCTKNLPGIGAVNGEKNTTPALKVLNSSGGRMHFAISAMSYLKFDHTEISL